MNAYHPTHDAPSCSPGDTGGLPDLSAASPVTSAPVGEPPEVETPQQDSSEQGTPDPVLEATGLAQWAELHEIDPDEALALVAAMFRGVAGPLGLLNTPWGKSSLPPLNLLVMRGPLELALERLLQQIRSVNHLLLETTSATNPALLDFVAFGALALPITSPKHITPRDTHVLDKSAQAILGDPDAEGSPVNDVHPEPSVSRRQSLRRPAILLERPRIKELERLLHGCHQFTALALTDIDQLLAAPESRKSLTGLLELMDGREIVLPDQGRTSGIEPHHPARVHVVARMDPRNGGRMVTELPGWLERSLVLGHAEPGRNTTAERFASGSTAASRFIGNFRKRIELLIHSRRAGRNPTSELPASDAAWCFGASVNDFERDCGAWCHEVGPSVRGLPMTIVWTLLHLMPDPRDWPGITGMHLVNTAVGAARRLAKRHHQTLASVSRADTHRKMLPLAQKVVDKIALKQPVSERDLMRSFDHQRKATYLPVLSALADADVILRTPDNFLRLGTRRLDEVEGFR